jgi:transmembrane sensor
MSLSSRLQILKRFIHGKSSAREEMIIDRWYHSVDDHSPITLWQQPGKKEAVKQKIETAVFGQIHDDQKAPVSLIWKYRWVAAAIVTGIIAGKAWWAFKENDPASSIYYSVTVPAGKIQQVQLPDSSIVKLRAGSVFRYSSTFGTDNRRVELINGEAFFEVRKNEAMPFIVDAGDLKTEVLGTAFAIQAYRNRPSIQVWVEHGKVQVSDTLRMLKILGRHQRLQLNKANEQFSCDSLYWQESMAWQKGVILLEAAGFEELGWQLAENYNIQLITADPKIREFRYDLKFFMSTPLDKVLKMLTAVHHVRYKKQGNKVEFY